MSKDQIEILDTRFRETFQVDLTDSAMKTAWNYNPNLLQDNIMLVIKPDGIGLDESVLAGAVTEALAFYALLQFYGEQDTYYGTAWRKHRAHIMLLLCRPSMQ